MYLKRLSMTWYKRYTSEVLRSAQNENVFFKIIIWNNSTNLNFHLLFYLDNTEDLIGGQESISKASTDDYHYVNSEKSRIWKLNM